jgi:DNA topoisomerase-3
LNVAAVRKAIEGVQPNAKFKPLYDAALGRQRADWLYGLNMTRLYTVLGKDAGYQGVLSVGRVQTPLLGLIVRRDLEIEGFVPKPYYEVIADIAGGAHAFPATWQPSPAAEHALDADGRLLSAALAAQIERKTLGQPGTVVKATRERKSELPPLPFSLAGLQVEAGRRLGVSPKDVLDICQSLYETHRLVTYPRSDCSYLPEGHLGQIKEVCRAIAAVEPTLAAFVAAADLSVRSSAWNDRKVTAHHAIIPSVSPPKKMRRAAMTTRVRRTRPRSFQPWRAARSFERRRPGR